MTTALLVIDFQRFVDDSFWQPAAVLANIQRLLADARSAGTPVVWVQHDDEWMTRDSEEWQLYPGLEPFEGEPRLFKRHRDSFTAGLDEVLRDAGADHVVITGAQSDYCVRTAVQSAAAHGYDVTLVSDGHTTCGAQLEGAPAITAEQMVLSTNENLREISYPGVTVEVRPAAEIAFVAA